MELADQVGNRVPGLGLWASPHPEHERAVRTLPLAQLIIQLVGRQLYNLCLLADGRLCVDLVCRTAAAKESDNAVADGLRLLSVDRHAWGS
jgi:hypothetical protein